MRSKRLLAIESGMLELCNRLLRMLRHSDGGMLLNKLVTSKENMMEASEIGILITSLLKAIEFLMLSAGLKLMIVGRCLLRNTARQCVELPI